MSLQFNIKNTFICIFILNLFHNFFPVLKVLEISMQGQQLAKGHETIDKLRNVILFILIYMKCLLEQS